MLNKFNTNQQSNTSIQIDWSLKNPLMAEICEIFRDGIAVMCICKLFISDVSKSPDPKMMFLHPINLQEL